LSRTPDIDPGARERFETLASQYGFDTDALIDVSHR